MTSRLFAIVFAFFFVFQLSCKFESKEEKTEISEATSHVFQAVTIQQNYGNCDDPDSLCFKIDIQYQKIGEGPETVKAAINKQLDKYIVEELNGFISEDENTQTQSDIQALITKLFDDYRSFIKEFSDTKQSWNIAINTKLIFQDDHLISILASTESYMGGAHGNHWKNILNFDAATGKSLSQKDIIINHLEFLRIAEVNFRKARGISSDADLEKEGYFFKDGEFKLPENIGFTDKGILLIFNPYEAGPYSMGEIRYTIPSDEVKALVRNY